MTDAQITTNLAPSWMRPAASWSAVCPPAATDTDLVAQVALGSEAALSQFYDRYSGPVLGLLTRMLGGGGEAEEVMQEVFLQVWRQAERYRPQLASPRGWLLMMARSRALDRIKACAAVRRREELVLEDTPETELPLGSRRLEQAERSAQVRQALVGLPADQRQAIELAFFAGLTHSQIAERLGAPLGTIKSRVLLGMRKLRGVLAALAHGDVLAVN
jgi:RNA polymerase sigma-70 factor (ECF subfamily)